MASVIIGARLGESSHIEAHQELLDLVIEKEDIELIEEVISKLNFISGNCVDEFREPPFLIASGDLSHHIETMPAIYQKFSKSEYKEQVYSGTVWESFEG